MRVGAIAGWVIAIGAVGGAEAFAGGALRSLVEPSAFLIVVGGSCGAVLVQSGARRCWEGVCAAVSLFRSPQRDEAAASAQMLALAREVRRTGALSLDAMDWRPAGVWSQLVGRRHVALGLEAVRDNLGEARVVEVMQSAIRARQAHLGGVAAVWEAAGGYAPTFGIIGAVLGLVHVMQNLGSPGALGPGIAQAFVSTLYGLCFANLVCLPIGAHLAEEAERELNFDEMLANGVRSIWAGENALVVRAGMQAFLVSEE